MKDELVSFETAKLAKEKGFDINTQLQYKEEDDCVTVLIPSSMMAIGGFFSVYAAPTQSLLQRWLREKHEIVIDNEHDTNPEDKIGYYFDVLLKVKINKGKMFKGDYLLDGQEIISLDNAFEIFEKGLEIALFESLKLIEL